MLKPSGGWKDAETQAAHENWVAGLSDEDALRVLGKWAMACNRIHNRDEVEDLTPPVRVFRKFSDADHRKYGGLSRERAEELGCLSLIGDITVNGQLADVIVNRWGWVQVEGDQVSAQLQVHNFALARLVGRALPMETSTSELSLLGFRLIPVQQTCDHGENIVDCIVCRPDLHEDQNQ